MISSFEKSWKDWFQQGGDGSEHTVAHHAFPAELQVPLSATLGGERNMKQRIPINSITSKLVLKSMYASCSTGPFFADHYSHRFEKTQLKTPPPFWESLWMGAQGSRVHSVDGDLTFNWCRSQNLHQAEVYFFRLLYHFCVQNIPLWAQFPGHNLSPNNY